MDTSELKRWKLICEIRFPGSVAFFDERAHLVQAYQTPQFDKWGMEANRIDIHNEDRQYLAFTIHRNAGIAMEDPPTEGFFRDHTKRWFKLLLEELHIERLNRIGVRSLMLLPQPNFEDLVALLRTGMFKNSDTLWRNFGLEPVDFGFPLFFRDGATRINLKFGPMGRSLVERDFESETTRKKLPEACLFADFDYFQHEPSFDRQRLLADIMRFVDAGCDQALEKTSSLIAEIGG